MVGLKCDDRGYVLVPCHSGNGEKSHAKPQREHGGISQSLSCKHKGLNIVATKNVVNFVYKNL